MAYKLVTKGVYRPGRARAMPGLFTSKTPPTPSLKPCFSPYRERSVIQNLDNLVIEFAQQHRTQRLQLQLIKVNAC